MNLPTKTIADIRALDPCYDPIRYAPEDWQGTALDVLRAVKVPAAERLWLVCQDGWIDDRTLRLFAVWCATGYAARDAAQYVTWDAAWGAAEYSAWGDTRNAQVAHLIKMLEAK